MTIKVSRVLDVSDGLQPDQFSVGNRETVPALADLGPDYLPLLDGPTTAIISVTGKDGRSNLTPVWFDYEGDKVLLNVAAGRKKAEWIRINPQVTFMLLNPANPLHWMSIKCTLAREISEDDPEEGARVTAQLDRAWTKYTGNEPPYALRDPSGNERRILFEFAVDRVATFGRP
jgi:nitroimidazol reductase NimA-like FMN-containing flavoprotein (pyridoxamine 5'-phosphate oxidase superfamily)